MALDLQQSPDYLVPEFPFLWGDVFLFLFNTNGILVYLLIDI